MASGHPPENRTVLVVEDEALIRMCMASFLEDAGYTILEAADGEQALASLKQHPEVALLLTDGKMPGSLGGLELVNIAQKNFPGIKAMLVSGDALLRNEPTLSANLFVPKPYSPQQIIEAVQQLLSLPEPTAPSKGAFSQ